MLSSHKDSGMIIEFTCMSTSPRRVSLRNYKVESQRLVNGAITFAIASLIYKGKMGMARALLCMRMCTACTHTVIAIDTTVRSTKKYMIRADY